MLRTLRTGIRTILPRPVQRRIYRFLAHRYIVGLNPQFDLAKKTILAINHFYDQDLRALSLANRDYNLAIVDAPALVRGAKLYFSRPVVDLQAPYNSEPATNRTAWREECDLIMEELIRRFHVGLLLTGADVYYWIRELIAAARHRGIKTVMIDKEGIISPHGFDGVAEMIRTAAPPVSDHMFVWSNRQRQFWNHVGVPDERITIVGQLRSDLFHHEHRRLVDVLFPSAQPLVTLFSYEDSAYIPLEKRTFNWQRMKQETHHEIMTLAGEFPQFNFVIKTHPQQSDLRELKDRYQRENLIVVGGAALANELIQRSELVIGFQTTAIIEAMFMGRHTIYTCWDQACAELRDDIMPYHEAQGICKAETFEKFRRVARKFLAGDHSDFAFSPDETAARAQFVNRYLYRPDGHVAERLLTQIGRFMA